MPGFFAFMAIKTYTEQLESVQAAIEAIEGGSQSYSIGGRSLSRADLGTLYARENVLMAKAVRETAGRTGPRVRNSIPLDT